MQSVVVFLVAVTILVVVEGRSPPLETCTIDSDCPRTHCCTDPNAPMVVSRKRQVPIDTDSGICRPYLLPGASCSFYSSRQCGCSPGLYCQYEPVSTTASPSYKVGPDYGLIVGRPGPGRYSCSPVADGLPD